MAEDKNIHDVVIIGGSLTGLFHGIALKNKGLNVTILERSPSDVRESQAAGIGLTEYVKKFLEENRIPAEGLGPTIKQANVYAQNTKDSEMKLLMKVPYPGVCTAWNVMYHRLRAHFDGFVSESCPQPQEVIKAEIANAGEAAFRTGCTVKMLTEDEAGHVVITYEDARDSGKEYSILAKLVVAADGGNSFVRNTLLPNPPERKYAGYFAWRGTFPFSSAAPDALKLMGDDVLMYGSKQHQTYTVSYRIPPDNGSTAPEDQILNFVWYDWCPADSPFYTQTMTDTSGKLHRTTLPPGSMNPQVWEKQVSRAEEIMLPSIASMARDASISPFVTVVTDVISPRVTFLNHKIVLSGEALAVARPHSGAAANEAARQALLLSEVVSGQRSWRSFEHEAWWRTRLNMLLSLMYAANFMGSKPQLLLAVLRLKAATAWYQLGKVWNR